MSSTKSKKQTPRRIKRGQVIEGSKRTSKKRGDKASPTGKASRRSKGPSEAYVLVPLDEYRRLADAGLLDSALARLADKSERVVDAEKFALELAADRITKAREAAGLTQAQLGEKLSLPQSQISRIERNPDHTTIRTLKKIARALGVDVSALV
ncbi:MAG: hypothetical protein AMXMBFR20_31300 [Planctomycetia bacterium]